MRAESLTPYEVALQELDVHVGDRVSVYYTDEMVWYDGVVLRTDIVKGHPEMQVHFDPPVNGSSWYGDDVRMHRLEEVEWRFAAARRQSGPPVQAPQPQKPIFKPATASCAMAKKVEPGDSRRNWADLASEDESAHDSGSEGSGSVSDQRCEPYASVMVWPAKKGDKSKGKSSVVIVRDGALCCSLLQR